MSDNDKVKQLTVCELFSGDKYIIPIYQREYDWDEKEARQLWNDIVDSFRNGSKKNYYVGSLVVQHYDGRPYEVVDGQQRLTTFNILMSCLFAKDLVGISAPNVEFQDRNDDSDSLAKLFKTPHETFGNMRVVRNVFDGLVGGYDKNELQDLIDYLLGKVVIYRVVLPDNTNLNHYFEVMNSRGVQLEKHEVLKARLMAQLDEDDVAGRRAFHAVWTACSQMDTYVQMNFDSKVRGEIFGAEGKGNVWGTLCISSFDDLKKLWQVADSEKTDVEEFSLQDILDSNRPLEASKEVEEKHSERFESVINFPNFLLVVLNIYWSMHSSGKGLVSIPLDDKKLLDSFSLKDGNAAVDAKEFLFLLLRQRFVFDQYVIKRDYMNGGESWSLKRLVGCKNGNSYSPQYVSTFGGSVSDPEDTPESRDVVMIQSMFNVSYTSQNYKYWLLGVLLFVEARLPLRESLISLAKAFAIRVYLRGECDLQNALLGVLTGEWHASGQSLTSANLANLDKGCAVENFIFNLYDYILWCQKNENFRFTYRSSVEHFYPQHPMHSEDMLDQVPEEHQRIVDQFGNLCLISSSMNSSFGNDLPQKKAAFHEKSSEGLSLKLSKMEKEAANWNKAKIDAETIECKKQFSKWLVE